MRRHTKLRKHRKQKEYKPPSLRGEEVCVCGGGAESTMRPLETRYSTLGCSIRACKSMSMSACVVCCRTQHTAAHNAQQQQAKSVLSPLPRPVPGHQARCSRPFVAGNHQTGTPMPGVNRQFLGEM